jgi:hypothetical protein
MKNASQHRLARLLAGILPAKMGYRIPKSGSDPQAGTRPARQQVKPGGSPLIYKQCMENK